MSTTYRVLCLSHDPAIIAADGDWNRPELAEAAIREGIEGHAQCELLIGAYSYPLVRVGCPGLHIRREDTVGCTWHASTQWMDADWLRLLWHAQKAPDGSPLRNAAGQTTMRCWTPQRLARIADELGVTRLV